MDSRSSPSVVTSSSSGYTQPASPEMPIPNMGPGAKRWVDMQALPDSGYSVDNIAGNAPEYAKRLACNTLASYGFGREDAFGVGKASKITEMATQSSARHRDRLEIIVACELVVQRSMANGAGAMHGGCVAYLIDNFANLPLIILGLLQNVNGIGVTQNMQVSYHAPAFVGVQLLILCTSVTLGKRVMSARCEISEKETGRPVASGFISMMQPLPSKL